jgi:Tfp pilus assembly protein PilX
MKRKGYAVLITIGVMAVLTVLIITFISLVNAELRQARNYMNGIKARYMAELGIARGIAELKARAKNTAVDSGTISYNGTITGFGTYTVTGFDNASQLNINDQNSDARLSQMLQSLNTAIGGSNQLTAAECTSIAANRPYQLKEELMTKAGISRAKYDRIKDYITIWGYVDPDTVDPQDVSTPFALQPRAPVNVNTASKPVLIAVLSGITALHSCPECGGDGTYFDAEGTNLDCPYCVGGSIDITAAEADGLADEIIANRPYANWHTLFNIIKLYFNQGSNTSSDQEVVIANANPNTGFSWCRDAGWGREVGYTGKYVIDMNKNGSADAADKGLTVSTTEFSFNSGGYYTLNATGQALDTAGATVGADNVEAVIKIYDVWRQTTQNQFSQGTLSDTVSYPEPTLTGGDTIAMADYSGEIALKRPDNSTPNTFRAGYKTGFSADASAGNADLQNPPNPGSGPQGTKPNKSSVANFTDRGELLPDGMLIDIFDTVCPSYLPANNLSNTANTMEFWLKTQWPSNDTKMYYDSEYNRILYRFMSEDSISATDPLAVPFSTYFFFSRNIASAPVSCSLGIQGYGFWNGADWVYYPNQPEGVSCYEAEFARNYDGGQIMGQWRPGEWKQVVCTWVEPENNGKCNPENTGGWPGAYGRDMKTYIDGELKHNTDWRFHHTPYGGSTPWEYMMIGHEWWSGSGSIHHYKQQQINGVIGSLRIWNSELNSDEVRQEYEKGIYKESGTFTSQTFSPGDTVDWGTISWSEVIPSDRQDITMFVDSGDGWNFVQFWDDPGAGQPIDDTSSSVKFRASLTSTTASASEPDKNILENPSFENGAGIIVAWPQNWNDNFRNEGTAIPAPIPDGTKAAINYWDGEIRQSVSITPGKEYRFIAHFYIPSNGSTGNWGSFIRQNGGGLTRSWNNLKSYPRNTWNTIDSGWVTATGTSTRVDIGTYQSGCVPANPTFFDDFKLYEKGTPVIEPVVETPMLDDVTITYLLPETVVYYWKHY